MTEYQILESKNIFIEAFRRIGKGTCLHNSFHKPGFVIYVSRHYTWYPKPETGTVLCYAYHWLKPEENCEIYEVKINNIRYRIGDKTDKGIISKFEYTNENIKCYFDSISLEDLYEENTTFNR